MLKFKLSKAKNVYDLLDDVIEVIEAEPLRLNMTNWLLREKHGDFRDIDMDKRPSCGTVACVAGWIVTLKYDDPNYFSIESTARQMLLGSLHSDSAMYYDLLQDIDDLFHLYPVWEVGSPQYVQTVVRAIREFQSEYRDHLIATVVKGESDGTRDQASTPQF